jgi:RNA polymerase sigma-70 factor (ECF subfamily)
LDHRESAATLYSENLDSAPAQSAGLSAPAVATSSLDATRGFTELSGLSIDELCQEARCESVDLRPGEFAGALLAVGNRYNFGLTAGLSAGRAQIGNFLRGLQLRDLALAQACALGRDAAWREFMARFRDPLTRAAVAMTGSEAAGEELADSLWPDMFGLSERGGERVSPIAGYSGRGSLMGFLRTTLAQRNVDRHRRTNRETELPATELQAAQQEAIPEPITISQVRAALAETIGTLDLEQRFLLSAWYLDQRTLLDISRIIGVHEATVSRRIQRLTSRLREELLGKLQKNGMSRDAAEEALGIDPRDVEINLRGLLQSSGSETFSGKRATATREGI